MDAYDVIKSILDANNGEINGRTAIQKLVYLAHKKIPELEIPQYKPQYFGPYSAELEVVLVKLIYYSFVSEIKIPKMNKGYKYELTSDGIEIMKTIKKENKGEYKKIKKVVDICKEFCQLKSMPLSFASKILDMIDAQENGFDKLTLDDAVENAKKLRWGVSPNDADQGGKLLVKLGLGNSS